MTRTAQPPRRARASRGIGHHAAWLAVLPFALAAAVPHTRAQTAPGPSPEVRAAATVAAPAPTAVTTPPVPAATSLPPPAPYGRLFFTREQRTALDANRRLAVLNASRPKPPPSATPAPPPKLEAAAPRVPPDVTLNGIVRRSDGRHTVWVNATPLGDDTTRREIRTGVVDDDGVEVSTDGSGRRVRIKVGQTLDGTTGRIEDSHRRKPRAAAAAPQTQGAGGAQRGEVLPDRDGDPAAAGTAGRAQSARDEARAANSPRGRDLDPGDAPPRRTRRTPTRDDVDRQSPPADAS
jgi:hypothetical protein